MKRFKKLILSFTSLLMAFGVVMASGCELLEQLPWGGGQNSSSSSSSSQTPPAHECESECPECDKCLDEACTEDACEEKCEGHAPAHECESECPKCGDCLDEDCAEDACKEKCDGHEGMYWLNWDLQNASAKLSNGSALPNEVEMGDALSFIVTENSGYSNLTVKANGVSLSSWNGVYTIVVNADTTFSIGAEELRGRKSYELTDATVTVKDQKAYYLLKGTYNGYNVAEMQSLHFDMQNYQDFNNAYGWTTTEVDYDVMLSESEFEMYVDLSVFPVETCLIPHFGASDSSGDVKVSTSDGANVTVNGITYSIDMGVTGWGLSTVTIMKQNGSVSAPSDTTPPTIKEIVNHDYFDTTELPSIYINTENGIALDDPSLEDGWKVPNAVMGYDYANATVGVSNCEGYEMKDTVAEVKIRGNYSSTYDKKPIRIKFDKKQAMCGLNGDEKFKNWVLLAEYKDSSMLRNSVAFYLGNTILGSDGFYCTDFRYVEVYLNGEYNGLYLLVEQQELKEERMDLPEAIDPEDEPDNPDLENPKIGYVVEFDGYYYTEKAEETFELEYDRLRYENGTWVTPSQRGYTIKSDVYFETQRAFIEKSMQSIWDIVYDATYNDHSDLTKNPYYTLDADGNKVADPTIKTPREAVEKVIDVRSLVDVYILNEICQDMDLGWSSFYMTLDMSETGDRLLTFEAPWDFDSTLGSAAADNTKLFALNKMSHNSGNVSPNPWLMVLSREAWFWTHVQAKWNALEEAGTFTGVIEMIDYFSTNYVDAYKKNFEKWSECIGRKIENQQIDLIATFQTEADAAAYLKAWLTERIENLGNLIDAKVNALTAE